jgi:hypothetical protein
MPLSVVQPGRDGGAARRSDWRRCPFSIEPRQSRLIRGIRCFVLLDLMHGRDEDAVGYLRLI